MSLDVLMFDIAKFLQCRSIERQVSIVGAKSSLGGEERYDDDERYLGDISHTDT